MVFPWTAWPCLTRARPPATICLTHNPPNNKKNAIMKEFLTDAIQKKISNGLEALNSLEALGGIRALYGAPIAFTNGEEIIPVGRISLTLAAGAEGAGGGSSGLASSLLAKGGGGGNADASIKIAIEPVGYLRSTAAGPVFCPLHDKP
jgi:uncharacterized spore protein YtfJ